MSGPKIMPDDHHPTLDESIADNKKVDRPPTMEEAIKHDKKVEADFRNVVELKPKMDLFGGAPTSDKTDKSKKNDKFEKILDNYITHLNMIFAGGAYTDCMETKEIIGMAEIKSCINISTHPRIATVESLYNKVIDLIRSTWNENEVKKWERAIGDELARKQALNSLNAFTCPTSQWSDITSEGKPKPPILCAIVALRYLLEQRHFTLKEDMWKNYTVIVDDKGNEQYESQQVDPILRGWRNWIYERRNKMQPMDVLKDAYHQIAKVNEFHSQREKVLSVKWDGIDRYEDAAKAFGLRATGEGEDDLHFTQRVFSHHLMASVARLFYPGVWYDLVLCTFGDQGAGKTTGLRILYGRDNIISCNFFELDPKVQSEKTRNGIWAVENPDTFGDARKADFNRIKADVSTDSYVGRDAYGRVEDMRRVLITYVIWYTGNEVHVLRDPTGNRRFVIVYSIGPVDEDWLRLNSCQLWAQAYVDMMALRTSYLEEMKRKGISEEYPKYLKLPRDLWDESKRRSDASMVVNEQLDDWVSDIIFRGFVAWPSDEQSNSHYSNTVSILVLTRDIINYLQKNNYKGPTSDQAISASMQSHIVLEKQKCKDLNEDVKWRKAQIFRNGRNLRGYRIDFAGKSKRAALKVLADLVAHANLSPEAKYVKNNGPM